MKCGEFLDAQFKSPGLLSAVTWKWMSIPGDPISEDWQPYWGLQHCKVASQSLKEAMVLLNFAFHDPAACLFALPKAQVGFRSSLGPAQEKTDEEQGCCQVKGRRTLASSHTHCRTATRATPLKSTGISASTSQWCLPFLSDELACICCKLYIMEFIIAEAGQLSLAQVQKPKQAFLEW